MLGVFASWLYAAVGPRWFGVLEDVGPPILIVVFALALLALLAGADRLLERGIDR